MANNWVILPETDKKHQNRYIVMVSAREDADNLIKKYPNICSEPFRILDVKYKWGIYLNNSTREERKSIYKYFMGTQDVDNELKKEDEIQGVISELNTLFSTLTAEEQRHLKQEIPERIDALEKFTEEHYVDEKNEQELPETSPEQQKDFVEEIHAEEKIQPEISEKTEEPVTEKIEESIAKLPNQIAKDAHIEESEESKEESDEIYIHKSIEAENIPVEPEKQSEAIKEENLEAEPVPEITVETPTEVSSEKSAEVKEEIPAEVPAEPAVESYAEITEEKEVVPEQPQQPVPEAEVKEERIQEEEPVFKIEIERFGEPTTSIPQISKPNEGPTIIDISSRSGPLKVLYLYPSGENALLENFVSKLTAIIEKSMKEPIYIEKLSTVEYSVTSTNDFNAIIKNASSQGVELMIAIVPDGLNDIRFFINKECMAYSMLSLFAAQDQLDKKFLYVDIAIELLLIKKKLRM